jgi:uncharacterized protein with LGFP repeats
MLVSSTFCWAAGAAGVAVLVAVGLGARRLLAAAPGGQRGLRAAIAAASALAALTVSVPGASASPLPGSTATAPAAATSWVARTPGVFGMGDSLFLQCGDTLGLGSRSLGMVGWWGGTTRDMRARMSSTDPNWPYMTESSHAEELAHFREAGSWVIGLGTNDVGILRVGEYRDNVDWFMRQAAGRPVEWFNIYQPAFGPKTARFNDVLRDAAARWPNLRILDWHGQVIANPQILHRDGLHIGSNTGCTQGRFRLIRDNAPPVAGHPVPSSTWTDAPASVPSPNPVTVTYQQSGGRSGLLGAPTSGLDCNRKKGGCVQFFAHGAIAWSAATGARVVRRVINDGWWWYSDMGTVGYPVEDTVCGLRDGGCRQRFETGTFYWSPRTAAQWVISPMQGRYAATGAENGHLGYPTTESRCNPFTRGCHQHFQRGTVSWLWASPGPTRLLLGPIHASWAAMGAENGRLGYATTERTCGLTRGGCRQHFQYGSSAWSSASGARAVFGAIRDRWHAEGAEGGRLGYPTAEERCGLARGGCVQDFQGGWITWSPTTGARVVLGAIRARWNAAGSAQGGMGYPVAEEVCGLAHGGCLQDFQWGTILWSPTTGARAVFGAIRDRWNTARSVDGGWGYPTAEERCGLTSNGCVQAFQRGAVYWSSSSGAHGVTGRIRTAWADAGAEKGRYGYPLTEQRVLNGRMMQTFQGGTVSYVR